MTVQVAVWLVAPLVPMMVSVYVPGAVVTVAGLEVAWCPHPLTASNPAATKPTTKIASRRFRAKNNTVAVSNPSGSPASE
jgi:hypothetical protein